MTLEDIMNKQLIPWNSFFLIYLQTLFDKVYSNIRKIWEKFIRFGLNIFYQFILRSGTPGSFSMNHFVKNESKSPNVAFWCVRLWFEDLRDIYKGVSTVLDIFRALYFFLANPKSLILTCPFESMMFAGFRSLNYKMKTCERFLIWREREDHCKFKSKC